MTVEPQSQHFLAPWCSEAEIPASRRVGIEDISLAFAIAAATDLLYVLSGRQFRSGRSLIRPTPIDSAYGNQSYLYPYSSMSGYGAAWGFAAGWAWTAMGMGWWQGGQDLSECVLQGPVQRINQVMVDGAVLDPSDYTLYDKRRLVRNVDATGQTTGAWPWNQQLQLPLTEPGTWCVDEETEILTSEGWRTCHQITPGDLVYTLDPKTQTGRFEPLSAVNIFPAAPRQMRLLETTNFSSLSTLDHRWFVWQHGTQGTNTPVRRLEWRTSETLNSASQIFRCAPRSDAPIEPKWSDAFVELVAWYWCEGSYYSNKKAGRRITIVQSEAANPQHTAAIRASLGSVFPGGWTEYRRNDGRIIEFRLKAAAIDAILAVTTVSNKAPTPAFLQSLTTAQLHLFIDRCIDGDGTQRLEGSPWPPLRRWMQVDQDSIRLFEMACALAGIATNTFDSKPVGARYGRMPTSVSLLSRTMAKPVDAVRVAKLLRSAERARSPQASDSIITYDGSVWCPTTPSRTWLARRRGTVYFTGNSIDYDWGKVPPAAGKAACIELALEVARSLSGTDTTRLPARVLSIATEGMNVAVGDALAYVRESLTGIPIVDLFLQAYNRAGLRRRTIMIGPNSQQGRELNSFS